MEIEILCDDCGTTLIFEHQPYRPATMWSPEEGGLSCEYRCRCNRYPTWEQWAAARQEVGERELEYALSAMGEEDWG